jgi:hypothetical protein
MKSYEMCESCEGGLFYIVRMPECDDCRHNGVWDHEKCEYRYDIDGQRIEASEEGHCELGETQGNGCLIYECSDCGHKWHTYFVDY